jgi:DNA polymerase-1
MIKNFTVDFAGSSYPAIYIDTKDKAEAAIQRMLESKEILVADIETAALPQYKHIPEAALSPHLARPRLIQMFTGKAAVVIDLFKTGELPSLKTLFETRSSCFHNLNFDLKMMMKWFKVESGDFHCSAIMSRLVWQALYPTFKSASLKDVAKALLNVEVNKAGGKSDWNITELTWEQVNYAAADTIMLYLIHAKLKDWIQKLNLEKCYEVYRKAQIPISMMELNGINFDVEHHKKNIVNWRSELADARDELQRMTGIQVVTPAKVGKWLKENLPPEVAAIWPRTDSTKDEAEWEDVQLATNADAFINFSHIEIVKPFAKYQKMSKLCTSFGMNLIEMINPATKRIHAGYTVCGARTGRVSGSNPNFQQSPRDKEFRKSFIPTAGYELVDADFSQIEVRYIAELAQEERMLEAFENGIDIYSATIAGMLGKNIKDITKDERQQGKGIVLGRSYGLGRLKQSSYCKKNYGITFTTEENDRLFYAYRDLYPALYKWQLRQTDLCQANRYTAFAALGKSNKLSEDKYWGASMNHPVQSGCASIMYIALILIAEAFKGKDVNLIANVHDEIILECRPTETGEVKKKVVECMEKAYCTILPVNRTLRNLVDPGSGVNWSEAKG